MQHSGAKPRPLGEQVIVIMGASSGIGREIALRAGGRGASVVVAARGATALHALVEDIREHGGHAIAVVADVTRWGEVRLVADRAVAAFGAIDTWVNCAAVSVFGDIADVPVGEL